MDQKTEEITDELSQIARRIIDECIATHAGQPFRLDIITTLIDLIRKALANYRTNLEADLAFLRQLHILRAEECDVVSLLADNPDPAHAGVNNAVICCGFWTGFADRRFSGISLGDAVRLACDARALAEKGSVVDLSALDLGVCMDDPAMMSAGNQFRYRQIVEGTRDGFKGSVIGFYRTLEKTHGVVVQENGSRIKHIYDCKHVK